MKKGYLEFCLVLVLVHMSCMEQVVNARHSHHLGECRRCPPGYGVERSCTRHRDTECIACAPDHYSARPSALLPCYPCSRCGPGLYVAHACTAATDTVCDSCHTLRGPHNQNFYERCIVPLLRSQENHAQTLPPQETVLAVDVSHDMPKWAVVTSGLVIGVLFIAILAKCVCVARQRQCKKIGSRYSYEAVATKDAIIML